jgi:8-oxo-dGTP pyrophosphatase MutT (NUDIX family)
MHLPRLFSLWLAVASNNQTIQNNNNKNNNNMSNDDDKSNPLPRIDSITPVASTKWLELQTISYTDQEGVERKWDTVTRTTKQGSANADAVVIVPLLKRYGNDGDVDVLDTILVEQFRPPMGQSTVEFPAGLIDKDETPEHAALRELREETGYIGEACKTLPQVSRTVCMSPGVTNESVHIVVVVVDLDNPYNKDPKPEPDAGEHIIVKRVSLKEGIQQVLDQGTSMPIEGVYLFALGLELGKSIGSTKK